MTSDKSVAVFMDPYNYFFDGQTPEFRRQLLSFLFSRPNSLSPQTVSLVHFSWRDAVLEEYYPWVLRKLAAYHEGKKEIADRIFGLESDLPAIEKVKRIWQQVKGSGDPQTFSFPALKAKYSEYYTQSVLAFWKKLPGGGEYLASEKMNGLSDFKKALKLKDWMQHNPQVLNLTQLDLSNLDLKFLPTEINLLINLKELYLENNQLQALPDNFNPPKLEWLCLRDNPLTKIPDRLLRIATT